MKKQTLLFLLVFSAISAFAQWHDNVWVMGYYGSMPHPDFGGMNIDFGQEPPLIQGLNTGVNFRKTNASICDSEGKLLFSTNGAQIFDEFFEIMENGDSLSPFGTSFTVYEDGFNFSQAALILPSPGDSNSFFVFHEAMDWTPGLTTHIPLLFYSVIDMGPNQGSGFVTEKNQVVIEDTLFVGKLTAAKHANGRDWWVVSGEVDTWTNSFYPILVSPAGVQPLGKQVAGPNIEYTAPAVGQAVFSPDGTKYIKHDGRVSPTGSVDIYGFNRCTGEFSHLEHFELDEELGLCPGAVVSPDSRYLYIITPKKVYQYDLGASDIHASGKVVADYDGYVACTFESAFAAGQLAPNGKIYFASSATDTVMHVINTPGQEGAECHVEQHSIALPTLNGRTVPNHPNYRLGPLDGSPCDTLGLDNFPMAGFAHFVEGLTVTFSDNSYYRPEEWEWDFGDSDGSDERNPVHSYDTPGEYEVCLTVSNENGGDTFCRWLEVDTTAVVGTGEVASEMGVKIYPNPVRTQLKLALEKPFTRPVTLSLHNGMGREVRSWDLAAGRVEAVFWSGGIPGGLYFWSLTEDGKRLASGKVMVE